MEINYKKILLIIGFSAVVIALGFAIYFMFFKTTSVQTPIDGQETPGSDTGQLPSSGSGDSGNIIGTDTGTGTLPGTGAQTDNNNVTAPMADDIASGGLTKIAALNNVNSFAPALAANGSDVVYYNKDDGKFYNINQNGVATLLSEKTFFDAENITWSSDRQKVVVEYPDGSNIVYNFQTNRQYSLPKHWKDFDFSPAGNNIVAKSIGSDSENRWLIVANEDGSQAQAIEPLGEKDATIYPSWSPNNLSIAMYTESIDFDKQKLYFVGLNDENFKATNIEGRGLEYEWDENGDKLLYSVYSSETQLKPTLWLVDAKADSIGGNRQTLDLQTWAHKCSFANQTTLYCAVPDVLPEGAGLFPELAQNSVDSLYKINTTTGAKTLIAIPEGYFNINDLMIQEDESNLYFTDSFSGNLYKVKLK